MLFALLGGFVACSDDDKNETPTTPPTEELLFSGSLEVTPNEGSPYAPFTEEEITMELQLADDGTFNLLMPEIKFVAQMPWLSIEIRGLQDTAEGDSIRFALEQTIPYFMGAPYESMPISNLSGAYDAVSKSFTLDFECNTMYVHYVGHN